jgi:hypothetical protein
VDLLKQEAKTSETMTCEDERATSSVNEGQEAWERKYEEMEKVVEVQVHRKVDRSKDYGRKRAGDADSCYGECVVPCIN